MKMKRMTLNEAIGLPMMSVSEGPADHGRLQAAQRAKDMRKKSKLRSSKRASAALKHTVMSWDWKDQPSEENLQELLRPFGVTVTAHPGLEGTDSYGFIFSNRPLTDEEYQEASEEM